MSEKDRAMKRGNSVWARIYHTFAMTVIFDLKPLFNVTAHPLPFAEKYSVGKLWAKLG